MPEAHLPQARGGTIQGPLKTERRKVLVNKSKKIIIALIGEKGAGKGTFIKILDDFLPHYTIERISSGEILGQFVELAGRSRTRDDLQRIPVALEKTFGTGIVSEMVGGAIKASKADIVVFDGVRWESDMEMLESLRLANLGNLNIASIVYITADTKTRYERCKLRKEKVGKDALTFEEFLEQESAPTETAIGRIGKELSDFLIQNNGSIEELRASVQKFIPSRLYIKVFRRVILETPFAGDTEKNILYARLCMRDCLLRGEAPYASHLLYTQDSVLDDNDPQQRELGIEASFLWRDAADATVVYCDLKISRGMHQGIEDSKTKGIPVEYRFLHGYRSFSEVKKPSVQ